MSARCVNETSLAYPDCFALDYSISTVVLSIGVWSHLADLAGCVMMQVAKWRSAKSTFTHCSFKEADNVTTFVISLHDLLRWLILAAGAVAIIRAAWGWLGALDFVRADNVLGQVYTGLLDLNVLIGIVVLVLRWGDLTRQAEMHPLVMILAAVVAHVGQRTARQRQGKMRHLVQGGGVLVSLVLVLIGIQLVT